MEKKLEAFVQHVLSRTDIDAKTVTILDFDLDRVFLAIDSTENNYAIRTWNIDENGIVYTLYKYEPEVEIILDGFYPFPEH